jgi:hypothetical protein
VIIIDRSDCMVREWKFEQGVTFPPPWGSRKRAGRKSPRSYHARSCVSSWRDRFRWQARLLADKLVDFALDGQGWAFAQIIDRLEGKPIQETNVNVTRRLVDELTDDELADRYHRKSKSN